MYKSQSKQNNVKSAPFSSARFDINQEIQPLSNLRKFH